MSQRRIFADDWRDCLREQYLSVIRQQDQRTEVTLNEVMYEAGFSEDDLAAMRLEATLRAEDMPDDYVPEEVKNASAGVDLLPEAEADVVDDSPPPIDEPLDELDEIEEVANLPDEIDDSDDSEDGSSLQQMSLF
jgi:hypothetical protein